MVYNIQNIWIQQESFTLYIKYETGRGKVDICNKWTGSHLLEQFYLWQHEEGVNNK